MPTSLYVSNLFDDRIKIYVLDAICSVASVSFHFSIYLITFSFKTFHFLNRFPHDDGTATSHLSAYSPSSSTTHTHNSHYTLPKAYLSVGAESGVVSLFGADRDAQSGAYDFFNGTVDANRTVRSAPKQLKSLLNLTTQITSSVFHPSGQIAAIASNQVCFFLCSFLCFYCS